MDNEKTPPEEQELIPIVDDEDEGGTPPADAPPAGEPPAQDAKVDHEATEGDDDGDDDEESGEAGDKDETNRRRRQQRRLAQKRARERQEQLLAQQARTIDEMARRLQQLEQHTVTSTVQTLDARIAQAEGDAERALNIIARATEAGNGDDVVAAQRIREAAQEEARALKVERERLSAREPDTPDEAPQVDPRVVRNAMSWVEANPWYDPNLGNAESRLAKQIDDQLVDEGYNPASREHWQELTQRLNEVFASANARGGSDGGEGDGGGGSTAPARGGRKGPPTSAERGGSGRATKSNEIYVAPERKQAMIDAGIWDDPVRRQRTLKEYQRFDAEQSAR